VTAIVFAGPTLPAAEAAARLAGAVILPPARQGDLYRAARDHRPAAIGLIDGVFLHEPAVWHREILWALSEGIHVFGAASMGALRAAELCQFGMRGAGRVFEAYRDGVWPGFQDMFEDDDEVAVTHAPAELGAAPLSDAMVDLRDTLLAAEAAGLLARAERDALFGALKAAPFPERSFASLLGAAERILPPAGAAAMRSWLPRGCVRRKRLDAHAMLAEMAAFAPGHKPPAEPGAPAFRFEQAQVWRDFIEAEAPPLSEADAMVLEELRLRPADWEQAARAALGRLAAGERAPASDDDARRAFEHFRLARGLARRDDVAAWRADNAMDERGLARLLREEAALARALAAPPARLAAAIADHARLTGAFAPLLRRARQKQATLRDVAIPAGGPARDEALIWFAEQNNSAIDHLRNDPTLAGAVAREYAFRRRES